MKTDCIKFIVASAVLLLSACASAPVSTSLLEQARSDYAQAQADPQVATYAAAQMQVAGEALARAESAASGRESLETVDNLAYLAKQKIALTREVASKKSSEADIAAAAAVRDRVRLEQRTAEANQARLKAQDAERSAQAARDAAALATEQKNIAQANAMEAQRIAAETAAHNQQLEAQLEAELAAKKTDRGLVITLGDVLFGTDIAALNANGMRLVQRLATVLLQNPARTVIVEGYTDSTGTARHNQELSERRAMSVRNALVDLGVGRERVTDRGFGASSPVAPNDTAENRQLNRRVEIILPDERGRVSAR